MEKIFDIIKEKLESPFLTNFFIGILIFNRKVIYTAFSLGHEDRIGDFYVYNNEKFTNKIELLSYINWDEDPTNISANLWLFPILYAIAITGVLPYIKSFFKAVHENADVFYEWFRIKMNRLKTVSEEKYNSLNDLYLIATKDVEKANSERGEFNIANIDFKAKNKKLEEEKIISQTQNETLNSDIKKLEYDIKSYEPSISFIFRGIWKIVYKFPTFSKLSSGIEFFKIVNGYELYVSDAPDGDYRLRANIDRYEYKKDGTREIETIHKMFLYDKITFRKNYFNQGGNFNENEYAYCSYNIISNNEIKGEESYTLNRGETYEIAEITITKIS
jgi:hypothetical protein